MADFILKNQVILIGGIDCSGRMNQVGLETGAEMKDNTAFGDATRSNLAGLKAAALAAEGFWDASPFDEALFANLGAQFAASVLHGPAAGDVSYSFLASEAAYQFGGEIGEVDPFSVEAVGADGVGIVRGLVLNNQNRTGAGNGTAFQLGAVAAGQRVYAGLHILSVGGITPTLDLIIQSDTLSFSTPTNRITFPQKSAIGSDWLSAAGPITDDYWRVTWTIGGTGSPNFTFAVTLGIL